ncbi:MAG: hypothetical protein HYR91_03680 [Flavobacteriia bacterium]|nr:hypothetical protein [Flavobacteriia bacterium]
MKNLIKNIFVVLGVVMIVFSCSTENNTFINRSYHSLNARYNGNFNANELLKVAINDYQTNLKEDYYSILPIVALPNEDEVKSLYSPIDTAVAKCTKVIQKHCMPSNDKPSAKTVEYNTWIDENWITIGKADYYRRDYEGAFKKFLFVKKFYENDPSIYISELWMAKINIALGKYTEANFNLTNLDNIIKEQEEKAKKEKEEKSDSKSKTKKKDKAASFPKKLRFDLEITKADLCLKKNEKKEAIEFLEASLKFAKKQKDKARVNFILGQLYEENGDRTLASEHFSKVLKYNVKYEMAFNARIKRAFLGNSTKLHKDLLRMLKDAKNAEYKDQIYYALADIEIQNGNIPLAKEYLTKSGFYSTTNIRQKGMAYERLGDLAFKEKDYVQAQKYYKECANVIKEDYPNADGIRNKAEKLNDLVIAVVTANYEDSVQRVAKLPELEREDFVKNVIKKTKEEEEKRKKLEAERLRELQQNQALTANNGNGSKWYFTNTKTRTDGFEEFKKVWGTRENEDDWRRSEKVVLTFNIHVDENGDTLKVEEPLEEEKDTLTVEFLTNKLPLSDSLFAISIERSMKSHYDAGLIYKDQLFENQMAIKEFKSILDKEFKTDFKLLAAFQMYRMFEKSDEPKAIEYKDYILNHFPNSDYANFLRDPDFFIKKKEIDALSEKEYLAILDRYNRKLYYPVIAKADIVIDSEKENVYRSKYLLLKAMCIGQTTDNKQEMIPVLEKLIVEYPKSPEAQRATELLKILKEGVSTNHTVDFTKKSLYNYDDKVKQWIIVFVGKDETSSAAKTKISDFNREFFSREKLKISSKIFGDDESIVLIQEFDTDLKAKDYVRFYKKTRKHLFELQKAKILVITQENLKILFQTQKLEEYEDFYNEHY